jgi:hypothetical protein
MVLDWTHISDRENLSMARSHAKRSTSKKRTTSKPKNTARKPAKPKGPTPQQKAAKKAAAAAGKKATVAGRQAREAGKRAAAAGKRAAQSRSKTATAKQAKARAAAKAKAKPKSRPAVGARPRPILGKSYSGKKGSGVARHLDQSGVRPKTIANILNRTQDGHFTYQKITAMLKKLRNGTASKEWQDFFKKAEEEVKGQPTELKAYTVNGVDYWITLYKEKSQLPTNEKTQIRGTPYGSLQDLFNAMKETIGLNIHMFGILQVTMRDGSLAFFLVCFPQRSAGFQSEDTEEEGDEENDTSFDPDTMDAT